MKETDKNQSLITDFYNPLNKKEEQTGSINETEMGNIENKNNDFSEKNESMELNEEKVLIDFLHNLGNKLDTCYKENMTFNDVYADYFDNQYITTKSHVKKGIKEYCLMSMIFIYGPIFGIVFLIGVFQIKSIMNALFNLIKESCICYYYCNFKSKCNVNYDIKESNVFDFYNYYYSYTINESIDVNLMMMTLSLGNYFLTLIGFEFSILFIFGPINIGAIFWLLVFDFKITNEFDYDWVKIFNLLVIYGIFYIGLGSSSLLSQQILIESYFKYKKYLTDHLDEELVLYKSKKDKFDIELNDLENKEKRKPSFQIEFSPKNGDENKKDEVPYDLTLLNKSVSQPLEDAKKLYKNFLKKFERLKKVKVKRENNKFDFFIMICSITTIGYIGKYLMNLFLDFILIKIYGDNYDKRLFLISIMILYIFCMILSSLLYFFYKKCLFELDGKEDNKNKNIKICRICGFIFYSESQNLKKSKKNKCCSNNTKENDVLIINNYQLNNNEKGENKELYETKNCCVLCCESAHNCCNKTFCYLLSFIPLCNYCCNQEPKCCLRCCEYDEKDYRKKEECFCYCYKARRKSYWCNKFFTNKTVKAIFPYMIIFFILQLTTIAFEKQYEKYKYLNEYKSTWIIICISTFFLFLYLTLSFSRLLRKKNEGDKYNQNTEINSNSLNNEKLEDNNQPNFKDKISEISNDILNGTFGILFFNGVFSFVFSLFYFVYIPEELRTFFFKDNINIIFIPVLLNNFYYFTLNYYCTYTAEKTKKFEFISSSSLIAFYIFIWDKIILLITLFFPEENENSDYKHFNSLYIFQLIVSSIPTLLIFCFVLIGLIMSTGIIFYDCFCCYFNKGDTNSFHLCLFFICSFLLCLGGIWIQATNLSNYEFEICSADNYCDIGKYSCFIDCLNDEIVCHCCCYENKNDGENDDCCYCHICNCCLKKINKKNN